VSGPPDEMRLTSDELEVVLLPELGARLHRIRAFGHDVMRTPDDPARHRDDPFFWGGYVMAPWCNRARAGRRPIAGRDVELRPNFEDGTAIHGLVSSRPWESLEDGRLRVELDEAGWPWPFAVSLSAAVTGAALSLRYRLENRADVPMPAGLGLHPWFLAPLEVGLPATSVYPSNTDSAPAPRPVDGRFDLRPLAPPAPDLDATWTALTQPSVELAWPELELAARLDIRSDVPPLVTLASPSRVGAVAVEPQTHGPDPLRRLERREPDAPVLLSPGAALTLEIGLAFALARNVR
jgi:aldose 1-epimerase